MERRLNPGVEYAEIFSALDSGVALSFASALQNQGRRTVARAADGNP